MQSTPRCNISKATLQNLKRTKEKLFWIAELQKNSKGQRTKFRRITIIGLVWNWEIEAKSKDEEDVSKKVILSNSLSTAYETIIKFSWCRRMTCCRTVSTGPSPGWPPWRRSRGEWLARPKAFPNVCIEHKVCTWDDSSSAHLLNKYFPWSAVKKCPALTEGEDRRVAGAGPFF
jgi:hypothetical protein